MARKSWLDKLNCDAVAQVKPVPINIAGMKQGQIMLVPTPKLVDQFVRKIPRGTSIDVRALRERLAKAHKAEVTCPITMGFHIRTVAEAAYESFNAGTPLEKVTPFWRVLDSESPTTKKLSFDPLFITQQRKLEGLS
ncbi:MAG: hypothetical protein ACRCWJ_02605 [Casimicrobium sp.]